MGGAAVAAAVPLLAPSCITIGGGGGGTRDVSVEWRDGEWRGLVRGVVVTAAVYTTGMSAPAKFAAADTSSEVCAATGAAVTSGSAAGPPAATAAAWAAGESAGSIADDVEAVVRDSCIVAEPVGFKRPAVAATCGG
jgi:hypothetical protein